MSLRINLAPPHNLLFYSKTNRCQHLYPLKDHYLSPVFIHRQYFAPNLKFFGIKKGPDRSRNPLTLCMASATTAITEAIRLLVGLAGTTHSNTCQPFLDAGSHVGQQFQECLPAGLVGYPVLSPTER